MSRTRCLILFLFGLGAMGWAGAPAKKEPPKDGIPLPATDSHYFLDVPEGVDPKDPVPIVVLAQNAPDQAKQTFDSWVPRLKGDHIFVACLNLPAGAVDQMDARVPRMIDDIHKKYENLDTRRMVLLGAGAGAQEVMKFVAGRPGYFMKAIAISPNGFPELPKKFNATGRTELLVTMAKPIKSKEPEKVERKTKEQIKAEKDAMAKEKLENKKIEVCVETLRSRVTFKPLRGEGFGVGGVSDKETVIAKDTIRSCYADAKRRAILEAEKPPDGEKTHAKDEKGKENPKVAKTDDTKTDVTQKAETGKETTKGPAVETKSADELLEDANKLETEQKYTAALKMYERLAKVKPGSEYERLANKKKDELMNKPVVIQALADEAAGPEPKRWLTAARSFEGADQPEKATAECKKIVSKYPGTSYADEARKILERLEAGNK